MEYVDGEYVLTNKISDQNIKEMRANMDEIDLESFDEFIKENWSTSRETSTKKVSTRRSQ